MTVLCLSMCSFTFGQEVPKDPPVRQTRNQQPQVQCEEMKKLIKQVQDHRQTCEVCKTNPPPRGMMGGQGRGPGGGMGRGPGGPPPRQ